MSIVEDKHAWIPQVVQGGKSSGGDGVEPYLLFLKWGGMFFAKDKTSKDQIDLILFKIIYIYPKARLVRESGANGEGILHFVDPVEFCRRFELYEILFEGKEDNEPVNRADSAAGNENYEPAKRIDNLDEGPTGR